MEWTVVTALTVLIGLFASVGAPVVKLNGNITRLNVTLERMERDLTEQKTAAKEAHRRIWAHNEEQDARLEDHETRLVLLERQETKTKNTAPGRAEKEAMPCR